MYWSMQFLLIKGNSFPDKYLLKIKSKRKKSHLIHKKSKTLFIRKALYVLLVRKTN